MKIHKYIWCAVVMFFLYGCFDDKGNYDYTGIPEVKVLGYITNEEELGSFWALTVGDVVEVEPILEYTGDSTALALKFEWIAENGTTDELKTIGFGKKLVWETDMGGFIRISLFITDTVTGYQIIHEELAMWPTNSESTSEAWMVLSEVDGKACFSILEDVSSWEGDNYVYRFREMLNYYPTQNEGQELGGRPVKIMNHWLAGGSTSAPGMLLLLQNGGIGPVYMGNQDYRRALYLKDDFMNGVLPNVNFKDAVANSKCHVLLSEDGGVYLKAVENLDVWFTGKYIDVPATIEGGMKIDRLIRMSYSGDITGTFTLDVLHDRLLYIQNENDLEYEGVWGDANAITEVFTEPVNGITLALNDLKDIDILYCGSYVGKVESESGRPRNTADVFMLYKDNRAGSANVGQYCIYTFLFARDYDLWINKATPKIERAFPAAFQYAIHEDGQFFVSPNGQYEFLFFSSGVNDSELWGYIFRGTGGTDPVKLFDFGGRKITRISSTESGSGGGAMGMDLTVALETGEIYMFNVNNSHFGTGITPKWMSTKSYGKIIDIRYDGPLNMQYRI